MIRTAPSAEGRGGISNRGLFGFYERLQWFRRLHSVCNGVSAFRG